MEKKNAKINKTTQTPDLHQTILSMDIIFSFISLNRLLFTLQLCSTTFKYNLEVTNKKN